MFLRIGVLYVKLGWHCGEDLSWSLLANHKLFSWGFSFSFLCIFGFWRRKPSETLEKRQKAKKIHQKSPPFYFGHFFAKFTTSSHQSTQSPRSANFWKELSKKASKDCKPSSTPLNEHYANVWNWCMHKTNCKKQWYAQTLHIGNLAAPQKNAQLRPFLTNFCLVSCFFSHLNWSQTIICEFFYCMSSNYKNSLPSIPI